MDAEAKLLARFLSHPKLEFLLRGWGFFFQDFHTGTVISHHLWQELGYRPDQFQGSFWTTRLHPDDRLRVLPQFDHLTSGSSDFLETEFRLLDSQDRWHWIRHKSIVLERSDNKLPSLYVGFDLDITAEREHSHRLEHSLKFYERRFWETESLRVAGFVLAGSGLDPQVAVDRFLHQAGRFLPFDAAVLWEIVEDQIEWLGSIGLNRGDVMPPDCGHHIWSDLILDRQPRLETDFAHQQPGRLVGLDIELNGWLGLPLVCQDRVVGVAEFWSRSAGGLRLDHLGAISALADPAATAIHNARRFRSTEAEAMKDPLTGILTRRSFERSVEVLRLSNDETLLALLLLDLDHFKQVNDTWGHQAGDRALQSVAGLCRHFVREGDLVCRWGGEEILVLLKGLGQSDARRAAERLRGQVKHLVLSDFPQVNLTTSVGVAVVKSTDLGSLADWIQRADQALYRAKNAGRDRVRSWKAPKDGTS